MRPSLPMASYLFILRKHIWLVAGTVAMVAAVGWYYARRQVPTYRASAVVKMKSGSGAEKNPLFGDDPQFFGDQMYLIRSDPSFQARVLEYLQHPPARPGPGTDGKTGGDDAMLPPLHDPALFQGVTAIPGAVSVAAIPTTSFYDISVTGGDPNLDGPIANAYAVVFAEWFNKERERRYRGTLNEYRAQLDSKQK